MLIVPVGGRAVVRLFPSRGHDVEIGPEGFSPDNGALLLVAIKDRKVRMEVGYGLEGPDRRPVGSDHQKRDRAAVSHRGVPAGVTAGVRAVLSTIEGHTRLLNGPGLRRRMAMLGTVFVAVVVGVVIGLFFLEPIERWGLSWAVASHSSLHPGWCLPHRRRGEHAAS